MTKADWLRSEIEKFEDLALELNGYVPDLCENSVEFKNLVLNKFTSIITRYKEELLELEKEV